MRVRQGVRFAIIPEWVIEHPDLSSHAVRLYALLARYANSEGVCRPSRATLAKRLHCSVKSIDRWKDELTTHEALVLLSHGGGDPRTANTYALRQSRPGTDESLVTGDSGVPATSDSGVALTRATEETTPPGGAVPAPGGAQQVVAAFVDTLTARGVEHVPQDYTRKLGGIAKGLIDKGTPEHLVVAAAVLAAETNRPPAAIHGLILEVQAKAAPRRRRYGRGMTTAEMVSLAEEALGEEG